jgi:hypothetical protein
MVGHGHVDHTSPLMGQDHEDKQQATRRRRDDEEVCGGNLPEVIRQKCSQVCDGGLGVHARYFATVV